MIKITDVFLILSKAVSCATLRSKHECFFIKSLKDFVAAPYFEIKWMNLFIDPINDPTSAMFSSYFIFTMDPIFILTGTVPSLESCNP